LLQHRATGSRSGSLRSVFSRVQLWGGVERHLSRRAREGLLLLLLIESDHFGRYILTVCVDVSTTSCSRLCLLLLYGGGRHLLALLLLLLLLLMLLDGFRVSEVIEISHSRCELAAFTCNSTTCGIRFLRWKGLQQANDQQARAEENERSSIRSD
jgi:hypothetical protein